MPSRNVRPLNQNSDPTSIHDGTNVLNRSEPPGYVCATTHPNAIDRIDQLRRAIVAAEYKTGPAIRRHTSEEFQTLVDGLVPGLLLALAGLMTTTAVGSAIGAFFGGVGAVPGAVIGFEVGVLLLNYLGVGFLALYVTNGIDQVMDAFGRGCKIAWSSCGDGDSIEAAASEFAEGIGIFFRLVLQAMVIYLLKAVSEARGYAAIQELSESKLFRSAPGLRDWLLANYRRLAEEFGINASIEDAVAFVPPKTQSYTYDMVNNPGPLGGSPRNSVKELRQSKAATFSGGKYNELVLSRPTILYRTQPKYFYQSHPLPGWNVTPVRTGNGVVELVGNFFSPTPPESGAISRIDSAVKNFWLNVDGHYPLHGTSTADVVFAIKIPAGTKIYYGPVSTQGGVHLGGLDKIQVYIEDLQSIRGLQVITETQLQPTRTQGVLDVWRKYGR